jgi:hypothetical protein
MLCSLLFSLVVFTLFINVAWAAGPARTVTIIAGSYIVDVNMNQDPPYVDQAIDMTVVLNQSATTVRDAPTSGVIIAQPGLGTDAITLHAPLTAGSTPGTLTGKISLPVRGAWNIFIKLDGPHGQGTGSFAVVAAAPGAIPSWLAWTIAVLPFTVIGWWIWRQHIYRHSLVLQKNM